MNTKLRKIKNNAKALSPVVASIILIAVTVAVSVVVAAWMGGMSIGLMGNAEQATITNVDLTSTAGAVIATVSNTGTTDVTITTGFINGVAGVVTPTTTALITKGTTAEFTIAGTLPGTGAPISVKLVTAKGNQLAYNTNMP